MCLSAQSERNAGTSKKAVFFLRSGLLTGLTVLTMATLRDFPYNPGLPSDLGDRTLSAARFTSSVQAEARSSVTRRANNTYILVQTMSRYFLVYCR